MKSTALSRVKNEFCKTPSGGGTGVDTMYVLSESKQIDFSAIFFMSLIILI